MVRFDEDDERPDRLPYVPGSETSKAAAEDGAEHAAYVRLRVFQYIKNAPDGATCDEIEGALRLRHQSASARIRELVLGERVTDSGRTRTTSGGRQATVWRVSLYPGDGKWYRKTRRPHPNTAAGAVRAIEAMRRGENPSVPDFVSLEMVEGWLRDLTKKGD